MTQHWPGALADKLTKYAYATTLLRHTPVALPASHRGVRTTPMVHAAPLLAAAAANVDDARRSDRRRESSGAGLRNHLHCRGLAPRAHDPVAWSGGDLGSGALVRSALSSSSADAPPVVVVGLVLMGGPGFRGGAQGESLQASVRGRLPRGAVMASLAGWRLPAVSSRAAPVDPPFKAGGACPSIARRSRTAMEGDDQVAKGRSSSS